MLHLISHRGNLRGTNSCIENHPDSIMKALDLGFSCEVDVWRIDGQFYLGHDKGIYKIERNFLETEGLWIHCKNFAALQDLSWTGIWDYNHVFFHQIDKYTLTSKGTIWAYPGSEVNNKCIEVFGGIDSKAYGVCSDHVQELRDSFEQLNLNINK